MKSRFIWRGITIEVRSEENWLGMDLTQFKPGMLNMENLVLGDGMALLAIGKLGREVENSF